VVDSDSLFPRQLFEEYDTPVDMIDGPISPECLEGVSFLHLGRQGAAGDALQTLAGLKQPPEVVEIRCAEASSGGEWRNIAERLEALGYIAYVLPEHNETRHLEHAGAGRIVRLEDNDDESESVRNIFAFRHRFDPNAFARAVAKLELDFEKRLRLRGREPKAVYTIGEVVSDGNEFNLVRPATANYLGFADFCHVAPGTLVNVGVLIEVSGEAEVDLLLCRDGATPYERSESFQRSLGPGTHRLNVQQRFAHNHIGVRLQVGLAGQAATIRVSKLIVRVGQWLVVSESDSDASKPFTTRILSPTAIDTIPAKRNLAGANRLFREGDYPSALAIYLELADQHPLQMYQSNAELCARRLKLPQPHDLESLREHYVLA
jgi:hypothetical protein